MKLISLSTMREVEIPRVIIGQLVRYTGDMANAGGTGAIIAIHPECHFPYDVALEDGREFPRTMLDGSRWIILHQTATPDALAELRAGVAARKAADEAARTSKAERLAQEIERVKRENPHLIQGGGPVIAAKNIRLELKRAFPAVKFAVKTSKYSGGNSVRVEWTDGPNGQQVEKIADKYAAGSFDGMTDCYNYEHRAWTEVFGSAKYVFCNREYSDRMVTSVIRRVCARLGGMDAIPGIEDYRMGRLYQFKQSGGCDVQREVNLALAKHTYAIERTLP